MDTDFEKFRLESQHTGTTSPKDEPRQSRQRGAFIRGPITLAWLQQAATLPGSSPLRLALSLTFQAGLQRSKDDIRLTNKLLSVFNLKKRTAYDALNRLEVAGLVSVRRPPGSCRVVNITDNS
ncbi:MAG: hypothetical protein ACI8P0_002061 [Planctomycetaceae bacterium]|jgi:hypothetical protein